MATTIKTKSGSKVKARPRKVAPIPKGAHTIAAYITVKDAAKAIAFYVKAFGGRELFRLVEPSGRIGHAEVRIGDSVLMISDEYPDFGALSPVAIGGTPVKLHLYVKNVDAVFARALKAGAIEVRPVADQFYGDRGGMLSDPFGHQWALATHIRDVSPKAMQKAFAASFR